MFFMALLSAIITLIAIFLLLIVISSIESYFIGIVLLLSMLTFIYYRAFTEAEKYVSKD